MLWIIEKYTKENETILDPFMGSGTTIEAAERTGRNSIGIEKDEDIFKTAVMRLDSFMASNAVSCVSLQSDFFSDLEDQHEEKG